MGPGSALPSSEWHSSAHMYTRGQLMRAGIIALILLAVLAMIVLY
jgi:hypothetical protein